MIVASLADLQLRLEQAPVYPATSVVIQSGEHERRISKVLVRGGCGGLRVVLVADPDA